jgi:hypothetical protein
VITAWPLVNDPADDAEGSGKISSNAIDPMDKVVEINWTATRVTQ